MSMSMNMARSRNHSLMSTRRSLLKGVSLGASGMLLHPMLARLQAASENQLPPTRFVFVVEGNGLPPQQIQPEGLPFVKREDRERTEAYSLADYDLPESLQPVAEFKHRMAIIQGLSGRMCTGGHSSDHGALGAFYANNGRNIVAPTIDGLLGKISPGIFSNVVLGIAADPQQSVIFNCSADAPGRSLATICRPEIAYSRLFGSVAEGEARSSFAARRNLLDYMQDDVRRVQSRLGSVDREKLDAYLSAFGSLQATSQRMVDVRENLAAVAPVADDKYVSEIETDRLDAHFELAAASLIGGLTNVVTIASGVGFPYFSVTFRGLGVDMAKHGLGHAMFSAKERSAWDTAARIRAYHFQLIARLMRQLDQMPEGDGTMLDNTVIVYLSDAAEQHHSNCWEWPMVVLGNARGALQTDGRCFVMPDYGRPGHRTINTVYNALLHASGSIRDDFGSPDPNLDQAMYTGPLEPLMA